MRDYYEELDFSEESFLQGFKRNSNSAQKFFQFIDGNTFQPEGRTVYAWKIPNFQGKEQQLVNQFVIIKGRHARIAINPNSLANVLVDTSPILYETTDTKLTKLADLQNSIAFDTDGHLYTIDNQKIFDLTDLSSLSGTSIVDLLGPLGRVFQLMDDNLTDYYEDDEDENLEEETKFDSFFENLRLRKI